MVGRSGGTPDACCVILRTLVLVVGVAVAVPTVTVAQTTNDVPRIMLPAPDDLDFLDAKRAQVRATLSDASADALETPVGRLGTVRALLDAGRVPADNSDGMLLAIGVILGDTFAEDLGLSWLRVEDRFGIDLAVGTDDGRVLLYPLTMIDKRLQDGETVDVFDLYDGVADLAVQQLGQAKLKD